MQLQLRLSTALMVLVLSAVLLATSATDDFNRGDGGLGASWTSQALGGTLGIVSNKVQPDSANNNASFYNVGSWGNDQSAEAVMNAASAESKFVGTCVRMSGTGGSAQGYCTITDSTGGGFCGIARVDGGSFTTLTSGCTQPANGSVIKLQATGTSLTFYDDGASISSTTDGTVTSGNPGLYAYGNSGGSGFPNLDDFSATDGGGGGGGGTTCTRMLLGVGCDEASPWAVFRAWARVVRSVRL